MGNKILLKRGVEANLPTLDVGEPAFTTDSKKPFIGSDTGNVELATKTQVEAVASGSPKGVYPTVTDLITAFPTGNNNIYLVTADGKWYYWNGSTWTAGGIYQSTGANNISITDAGGLYTATNVEGALQEVKNEVAVNKSDYANQINNILTNKADNSRIDEIITTPAESVSAQEIIDARQGKLSLGANLTAVKAQIDSLDVYNNKLISQSDFVDIIKNLTSYNRMRFKKISNTEFQVILDDGFTHITYTFLKNTNDDFIMLHKGYAGDLNLSQFSSAKGIITGTGWNTTSANSYTTIVGDSFSCNVKGEDIKFYAYTDNRGGVWKFVIDGDELNPINISVFSTVANSNGYFWIAKGLKADKIHSIKATFMGDDPNNIPSGGVGTSRGWLFYSDSSGTILGYIYDNINQNSNILGFTSNKEFAFNIAKNGVTSWIPEHNGVGSAFKIDNAKIMLNSREIDLSTLTVGEFIDIKKFNLIQHFHGKVNNVNIFEAFIRDEIDLEGVCAISGNVKFLDTCIINAAYALMMPLGININEILTSIGNNKVSSGDETYYYFTEEKDNVYSAVGLHSNYQDSACAVTIDNPITSLRKDKEYKGTVGQNMFLWQRSGVPKLYFKTIDTYNAMINDSFSWCGRFTICRLNNIYKFIKG